MYVLKKRVPLQHFLRNSARMAESVDALVSNTSGDDPCRFDPGSGYKGSGERRRAFSASLFYAC